MVNVCRSAGRVVVRGPLAEHRVETRNVSRLTVGRRERRAKRERARRRPMSREMLEPLTRLEHGRNVARRNPPQREDRPIDRLEPPLSPPQRSDVLAPVDELL